MKKNYEETDIYETDTGRQKRENKILQNACFINDHTLLYIIQSQTTNHPGGISMPIGFVRSEEKEETWIDALIKHILSCKDVNCFRCAEAVHHQYWTFID